MGFLDHIHYPLSVHRDESGEYVVTDMMGLTPEFEDVVKYHLACTKFLLSHTPQSCQHVRDMEIENLQSESAQSSRSTPRPAYLKHREEIYGRDGHRCVYCGSEEKLTLDHVIPQSRGGGHEQSNLVCCCATCNSSKGAKTPEEWRGQSNGVV